MTIRILARTGAYSLLALSLDATAQVTVYGLLDIGPTYISNQGGNNITKIDSGTLQQSRFGLRGNEDLGGGYSAFFALENGFNLDDGSFATSNTLFSRDARVGLRTPAGTLSLGRQSNATVDAIAPYAASMLGYGPSYFAAHPGNHDRLLNMPADNSIKYVSPAVGGLSATVAYAAGEAAGSGRRDSTRNVAVSYLRGPLSLGAAYLWRQGSNPTNGALLAPSANPFGSTGTGDVLRSAAVGGSYQFDGLFLHANATRSEFAQAGARARTLEAGAKFTPSPAVVLGADVARTDVHAKAHMSVLTVSAAYFLSKRTSVYVVGARETVAGTNAAGTALAAQIFTLGASSTDRQRALRLGVRHTF